MQQVAEHVQVYHAGQNEGIRERMRGGDVLLFRGRGLLSWIIRKATGSDFSHAGLVFRFRERVYCLEAVGGGVRLAPLSWLVGVYHGEIHYFTLEADPKERQAALGFAFEQLCRRYDKIGLVRFGLTLLFGLRRSPHQDDRWFCSELVAQAYRVAGAPLTAELPSYASPADLIDGNKLEPGGKLTLADV
jgi:hypothetical protein